MRNFSLLVFNHTYRESAIDLYYLLFTHRFFDMDTGHEFFLVVWVGFLFTIGQVRSQGGGGGGGFGGNGGGHELTCGISQASVTGFGYSYGGGGYGSGGFGGGGFGSSGSGYGSLDGAVSNGNGTKLGILGASDRSNRTGGILGGTQVISTHGRHCWIAEIRVTSNNGQTSQQRATGAIINEYSIITTASAVQGFNAGQLRVRIGSTSDTDVGVEYTVSTITRHPGFRIIRPPNYPVGDLAVLQLSTAIDFFSETGVCGACLPEASMSAPQEPFLGDRCHVAGYGATAPGGLTNGQLRQVIKKGLVKRGGATVMVPIIPTAVCDKIYRVALNRPTYTTDASSICAGGQQGKDTCVRDGGAPLACISPDRYFYVVAGLSSFGIGCGQPGIPSVYTNLANPAIRTWIANNAGPTHPPPPYRSLCAVFGLA